MLLVQLHKWYEIQSLIFPFNLIKKECESGWYGDNCNRPCLGHCKDGATCNHVTGQCDAGCDAGWTGYLCEKGNLSNTNVYIVYKIY